MEIQNAELAAGITVRDDIAQQSSKIAADYAALGDLTARNEAALADAEAKFAQLGNAAAERWLASGATDRALEIDAKARAELQRIREECAHKRTALAAAMKRKETENAEISARYAEAQSRVTAARARVLGERMVAHDAEMRALEDRVEAMRRVAQGLQDAAFACDKRIAGEYTAAIDRARTARIESRWPEIDRVAGEQLAAILARIPS